MSKSSSAIIEISSSDEDASPAAKRRKKSPVGKQPKSPVKREFSPEKAAPEKTAVKKELADEVWAGNANDGDDGSGVRSDYEYGEAIGDS